MDGGWGRCLPGATVERLCDGLTEGFEVFEACVEEGREGGKEGGKEDERRLQGIKEKHFEGTHIALVW